MDYDRLRELQQKYDENPRRYFAPLANEYRKGGQLKRAIDICRAQLAEMPGHMSGQIVFGQALYEVGEFGEARQVFERAIALDPENLIALRSLGDMSLQAGETTDARGWYTRLLDADPKDTAVIALVTEIDASADASPVAMDTEIPGVDSDAGDQEIPALEDPVSSPEPATSPATAESSSDASAPTAEEAPVAPEGLERHYPVEEPRAEPERNESLSAEGLSQEELGVPIGNSAAEGLKSIKQDVNAFPWSPPSEPIAERSPLARPSGRQERVPTPEPEPEPKSEPEPVETAPVAKSAAPAPEEAPRAPVASSATTKAEQSFNDAGATRAEEKTFDRANTERPLERTSSGASTEPFVNETMAQLYLQQGYKQLALSVYRQLAEARPHDASLRTRIAEIEAEDAAAHPEEVAARQQGPSIERPTEQPAPRSPSIESPMPGFEQAPIDSPPSPQPRRGRESVESPVREEPGAEPDGMSGRQPSIREFFATLGRRRPPRATSGSGASNGGNNQSTETRAPLGAAPPSASLDAVFAGATVSPSDARAASRLAGAFSGASGASRTPPTPPMPTPRVNPRVPQAQESEEDVAKFRAWLDGLTGE